MQLSVESITQPATQQLGQDPQALETRPGTSSGTSSGTDLTGQRRHSKAYNRDHLAVSRAA